MSLCPTNDIHSVYLDNELPEQYLKLYEEHIHACPKCYAELEKIKNLRINLCADNSLHVLSKDEMQGGFERLQFRLRYSKNTNRSQKNSFINLKYVVSAASAVAAAVIFALIIPFGSSSQKSDVQNIQAVHSVSQINHTSPLSVKTELSGNIPTTVVAANSLSTNAKKKNILPDVDVFRPNFDNENSISVKITVPGIGEQAYTTEIVLPVELYNGTFRTYE